MAWHFMNRMIKTGAAILSAAALLTCQAAFAQNAAASSESSSSSEISNEDIMNVAIVCVATYDMVVANGQAGANAAKIKDARELARSIYMEASGDDAAKADADIVTLDAALKDEVAKGTMKLDELHTTCDSLLMEEATSTSAASPS